MLLKKLDDYRILDRLHRLETGYVGKPELFIEGLNFLQRKSTAKGGFYPSLITNKKMTQIRESFEKILEKHKIGTQLVNKDIGDLLKYGLQALHSVDRAIMDIRFDFDVGRGSLSKKLPDKDFTESQDSEEEVPF